MNKFLRYPAYVLGFIALSALSGFITLKIMTSGLNVTVPAIQGRSVTEADRILDSAGLKLKISGEAYDASIPAGSVVAQGEKEGSTLKKNSEVKVTVSKGPERKLIPAAVGLPAEEAQGLLRQKGIAVSGIIYTHSDTVPEGSVVAQKPSPDEWAGETVGLIVSKGPYDVIYYCPDFKGLTLEEASNLAGELGLAISVGEGVVPKDKVSGQKPEAGSIIKKDETVYLIFNND